MVSKLGRGRDHAFLDPNFNERLHSAFNVFRRMSSRDLDSDSCFAFGHHRIAESNNINTLLSHHFICELGRQLGIPQIHWGDRAVFMSKDGKASILHLSSKSLSIVS